MAMEMVICVVHIYQSFPIAMICLQGGREGGREGRAGDCRKDWRAAGVASAEPRGAGSVAGERHWAARDGT